MKMYEILEKIRQCDLCELGLLDLNKENIDKGHGKLLPFWREDITGKIMLVGLNPSYRRFPGIHQAFGGEVKHNGTGYEFIQLLEELEYKKVFYSLSNRLRKSRLLQHSSKRK